MVEASSLGEEKKREGCDEVSYFPKINLSQCKWWLIRGAQRRTINRKKR